MTAKEEVIEIENGVAENVTKLLKQAGIYGLDIEKAEELGAIDRISYMLCTMHACVSVAYSIFGQVDTMLTVLHGRKHDISKACNKFERDYEKFIKFWTQHGYQSIDSVHQMNTETEMLYHQVMRWAQLPEQWQLGDPQHVEDDTDVMISVDMGDRFLKFHRSTVDEEPLSEASETWCVTKLDVDTKVQTTVYQDMDKASAQMSAKRLSAEDTKNIYTASILHTVEVRRTDALPMKAYRGGDIVGKVGKEFKEKK